MADTARTPFRDDPAVALLKKIVRILGGTVDAGDTEQTLILKWARLVIPS